MANIKRANASSITKSGVAIADVPDAPTIGAVTDTTAGGTVNVSFTPAVTGGAVTTYTATSTPGSITGTGASSPITVSGLTDGTSYTFKVKGTNSTATGPESSASASVTPTSWLSGAYDSIATTTVGAGGTSTITFSSIPQTYTHLQIRGISNSSAASYIVAQFNGDTASNYSNHAIYADQDGTLVGQSTANASSFFVARSNYAAGNMFGAGVCDILDYTNTNKNTTTRTLAGNDSNNTAGGVLHISSGNWRNTAAITSILIYPTSGNFSQYSHFALYGIKGE